MSRDCRPIYWPTQTSDTLPEEDTGKSQTHLYALLHAPFAGQLISRRHACREV